ncbi:MAG TPA: O-antigen ligase family protein [Usitatibacter sp.]|nr:O-antigen ligase family protein [Usitatibacter sp.]
MAATAPTLTYFERLREWRENLVISPRAKQLAALAGLLAFGGFWGLAVAVMGPPAAIICISLIACVFIVRDFRVGAFLLILIMPIAQSYLFPREMFGITGANPLNLLMAATIVCMVVRVAGDGTLSKVIPRPLFWLFIVPMAMGAFLGAPHAHEIPSSFIDTEMIYFHEPKGYVRDMFLKPLTFVVYALLVSIAVRKSEKPERFIVPMALSVWIMALVVVGFVLMAGVGLSDLAGEYARHFFSPLGMHANDLGRLYAVAYAILLFVWDRTARPLPKLMTLCAMGAVAIALALTFSRGSIFAFIAINLIYVFSRPNRKTLFLMTVVLPIGLYLTPGAIWYRMTSGWSEGAEAASAGRMTDIWYPLLPELHNSPVWGNGLGAIMWSKPMITGTIQEVAHPHNAYLQALYDVGIIGLVALLAFWFITWRGFRKFARDERLKPELRGFFEGSAAGLVGFAVAGIAGSSLMPVTEQAFLWLAAGVLWGVQRKLAPPPAKKRKR